MEEEKKQKWDYKPYDYSFYRKLTEEAREKIKNLKDIKLKNNG